MTGVVETLVEGFVVGDNVVGASVEVNNCRISEKESFVKFHVEVERSRLL